MIVDLWIDESQRKIKSWNYWVRITSKLEFSIQCSFHFQKWQESKHIIRQKLWAMFNTATLNYILMDCYSGRRNMRTD